MAEIFEVKTKEEILEKVIEKHLHLLIKKSSYEYSTIRDPEFPKHKYYYSKDGELRVQVYSSKGESYDKSAGYNLYDLYFCEEAEPLKALRKFLSR